MKSCFADMAILERFDMTVNRDETVLGELRGEDYCQKPIEMKIPNEALSHSRHFFISWEWKKGQKFVCF